MEMATLPAWLFDSAESELVMIIVRGALTFTELG